MRRLYFLSMQKMILGPTGMCSFIWDRSLVGSFVSTGRASCEQYVVLIGDIIFGSDFQILAEDTVIRTKGDVKVNYLATPLFQYKKYLFGWGGSYGVDNRSAYLLTPYLASINNLDEAVVKTTDKTMRITYTLTEETE